MKKTYVLLLTVMAFAGIVTASFHGKGGDAVVLDSSPVGVWEESPLSRPMCAVSYAESVAAPGGYMLDTDTLLNGAYRTRSVEIVADGNNTGNYIIKQIYGYDTDCRATVSGNTISIPVQELYRVMMTDTESAPVSICRIDVAAGKFDAVNPLTGIIAPDGSITLDPWGLVVLEKGSYYGTLVVGVRGTVMRRCNATLQAVDFNDKTTRKWGVIVSQPYRNRLEVENFANSGETVGMTLSSDGKISMPSQYVGTNSLGHVFTFSIDASRPNPTSLPQAVEGSVSGNTITINPWGAFPFNNPAKPVDRFTSTVITTTLPIGLPTAVSTDFEGEGTKESPWLIKTYSDLVALSDLVNSGHDQSGKYFRQTADIDCSDATLYFSPIGHAQSNLDYWQFDPHTVAFNGHYDGAGHAVKNLTLKPGMRWYMGLFGVIGQKGTVRDLTLADADMESYGRIVGMMCGLNLGRMENCEVKGGELWTAYYTTGGLTGMNFGTVSDCGVHGTVVTARGDIGGIAGYNAGIIENSSAAGEIELSDVFSTSQGHAGGIAGVMKSDSKKITIEGGPRISGCFSYGSIRETAGAKDAVVGGIVGGMTGTKTLSVGVSGSFSMITLSTQAQLADGLFAGLAGSMAYATITDCFFAGMLHPMFAPTGMGGIVARLGAGLTEGCVSNCYSSGRIVSANPNPNPEMAVCPFISTGTNSRYFKNVYYDSQACGLTYVSDTFSGALTTEELTGTTLPEGFSSATWTAAEGLYPRLKGSENNVAASVAVAPAFFIKGESVRKVKSPFTVATAGGVSWGILADGRISEKGTALTVSGDRVTPGNTDATEILCAYTGDGMCRKEYSVDVVPAGLFEGEGTEENPYLISSLADLKGLAEATTVKSMSFEGDWFRMTADIDCGYDPDFNGIAASGSASHVFAGTFDGNGHTISRLLLDKVKTDASGTAIPASSKAYCGLFGRVATKGVIRNLTIAADSRITLLSSSGAFAGTLDGRIENCINLADVTGVNGLIGGIAGVVSKNGVISGCYNAGHIRIGSTYGGGLAGNCAGRIEESQNDGQVSGTVTNPLRGPGTQKNIGGISGQIVSTGVITDCLNTGIVISYGGSGGITGYVNGGSIGKSVHTGLTLSFVENGSTGALGGNSGTMTMKFADIYFDSQLNVTGAVKGGIPVGVTPLPTSALTSGVRPEGLDPEKWTFTAGAYPVLTRFAALPQARAFSQMTVIFADGQIRSDVHADASLNQEPGLSWSLRHNTPPYSIEGTTLKVAAYEGKEAVADTLQVAAGDLTRFIPVRTLPSVFEGKGTAASPYLIRTAADLVTLSDMTNRYSATYQGCHFKITADIDCGEVENFIPIGYNTAAFGGWLDGDGHTVSNLIVAGNTEGSGLFGTLTETSRISNLTLRGGSVTTSGAQRPVGAFAAYCAGRIENCDNHNSVSTLEKGTYAAGIVAQLNPGGSLANCRNYGAISTRSNYLGGITAEIKAGAEVTGCENFGILTPGGGQSGAIAGTSYGTLRHCVNHADVETAKGSFGGIIGYARDTTVMYACINLGRISVTSGASQGGGLVGYAFGRLRMDSCINRGDIDVSGGYAGGLIGRIAPTGTSVSRCENHGTVSSGKQYAGGLVGYADGNASKGDGHFSGLTNYGSVEGTGNYIAGAFGYIKAHNHVEKCVNLASVKGSAGNFTSGFAGYGYADFSDCLNAGKVEAEGYGASGFVGEAFGSTIRRCANTGSVTSSSENASTANMAAAGFWTKGWGTAEDCMNLGEVKAPDFVAGMIGNWSSKCTAARCYTAAPVIVTAESAHTAAPFIASAPTASEFTANSYDSSLCAIADTINAVAAEGVTSTKLMGMEMGDEWLNLRATYPLIRSLAKNPALAIASIGTIYTAIADKADNVTAPFYIGWPGAELVWSMSPQLALNESDPGEVRPISLGDAWIKVATPDGLFSRTFTFTVNGIVGVDTISDTAAPVQEEWYTLSGLKIDNPTPGQIYILRRVMSDGSVRTEKRIPR